jgi:FMN-dependent NADH-azoreductase
MSKILYLQASPRERSRARAVANTFLDSYRDIHSIIIQPTLAGGPDAAAAAKNAAIDQARELAKTNAAIDQARELAKTF